MKNTSEEKITLKMSINDNRNGKLKTMASSVDLNFNLKHIIKPSLNV